MDLNKISTFIRTRRKKLGMTQQELAEKLFVTEKAVSRWETGRGTPDISLLIPLSKALNVDISEILSGESKKTEIEKIIEYNEFNKKHKFNLQFKLIIMLYVISILLFLIYLRFEYDPSIKLNYFIRLFITFTSSLLIIIANKFYSNNYVEKLEDKKHITTFSQIIVFIYYIIFIFNMVIFARYNSINSYNLIPFKSISNIIIKGNLYSIVINILGNFLIFMPLQYFIIELFKIEKFWLNLIVSILILFIIEILQFIFKVGVFDIDDIILCSLGIITFYNFYNYFKRKLF